MNVRTKKLALYLLLLLLFLSGCSRNNPLNYTRPSYPLEENTVSCGEKYVPVPIRCKTLEEYEAFLQNTYIHETFVHYDDLSSFGEFVEYWANVSPDAEHVHEYQHYVLRESNGNLIKLEFWHMFDASAAAERELDWRLSQSGEFYDDPPMPDVEHFLLLHEEPNVKSGNYWYGDLRYLYQGKKLEDGTLSEEIGPCRVAWLNGTITANTAIYVSPYSSNTVAAWENVDLSDESSLLVQFLDPEKAEDAAEQIGNAVSAAYWSRWFQRRWHLVILVLCAVVLCTVVLIKWIQHIMHIRQLAAGQPTSQACEPKTEE